MSTRSADDEILLLYQKLKSERKVAKELGKPKTTIHDALVRARQNIYRETRIADARQIEPYKHKTKRLIFTTAQDGTKVHEPFLRNLEAYAKHHDAELLISGFTYNKNPFFSKEDGDAAFSPLVLPYMVDQRINVGKNLAFCGEMNNIPTAVRPLSGLTTYTQARDGIFPHVKVALVSVPTLKMEPSKINMTTGTVTMPNYIQKKAGQKAEFHHVFGAVIVELTPEGHHYSRHVIGDEDDGSFYDLNWYVEDGEVFDKTGESVDVVNWGDIHVEKMDKECFDMSFGDRPDSVMNHLKPKIQCLHDVTDFEARNHHNLNDHHFMYDMYIKKKDSVERNMIDTYEFLKDIQRDWCTTYVIESNHHEALIKWLKTTSHKKDPVNAIFYLDCERAIYQAMRNGDDKMDIYEHSLNNFYGDGIKKVVFVPEDGSLVVHDVEHGLHGHRGANGARGSIMALANIGAKVTVGHSHSAAIYDGAYSAGVSGSLDMKYNKGLSSWSQSHSLLYPSGKRAIITKRGNRFYA